MDLKAFLMFNAAVRNIKRMLVGAAALGFMAAAIPGYGAKAWAFQHEHSKVDFKDYTEQTFEQAKRENKPVFMVLSASWCYWCRRYEEQTFSDEAVSELLNRNFINVFVDFDQRQDLQQLYMRKGIPTSVIFLPNGKEYLSFSGILGPEQFIAGMRTVIAQLSEKNILPMREETPSVRDIRELLEESNGSTASTASTADTIAKPAQLLKRLAEHQQTLLELVSVNFDQEWSGFGTDKKYPQGRLLHYLLNTPFPAENKAEMQALVRRMLDKIADHLFDKVQGGFFRYSDKRDWQQPRTEKMLTNNANLILAFQKGARIFSGTKGKGDARAAKRYQDIYQRSLGFFLKTFYSNQSGFYGSLDGRNPRYYQLSAAKRKSATPPQTDRTIFTAWNGEALYALYRVYRGKPTPRLKEALVKTADLLYKRHRLNNGAFATYLTPASKNPMGSGQLKDAAWGALAMVIGFELTREAKYMDAFKAVLAYAKKDLFAPEVGAFRTWNVPNGKGLRDDERVSRAIPLDSNGVLSLAMARAHRLTGDTTLATDAAKLASSLSAMDISILDEDPDDTSKLFLQAMIPYLESLSLTAGLDL